MRKRPEKGDAQHRAPIHMQTYSCKLQSMTSDISCSGCDVDDHGLISTDLMDLFFNALATVLLLGILSYDAR